MTDRTSQRQNRTTASLKGYAWGFLAVITCPCHLPLVLLAIAGTSAGAVLTEHWLIAAVILVALFGLSVYMAKRSFDARNL